jgi:hypothetical protein
VIEVRGVRGEHDRAAPGLDRDNLKPGGVPADAVDANPWPHLVVTLDDPDLVRVVQGHQMRQDIDVGGAAKGRDPAEGAHPERDFLSLEGIRISRALARVPCLAPTFTSYLPGPRRLSRDAPLA